MVVYMNEAVRVPSYNIAQGIKTMSKKKKLKKQYKKVCGQINELKLHVEQDKKGLEELKQCRATVGKTVYDFANKFRLTGYEGCDDRVLDDWPSWVEMDDLQRVVERYNSLRGRVSANNQDIKKLNDQLQRLGATL